MYDAASLYPTPLCSHSGTSHFFNESIHVCVRGRGREREREKERERDLYFVCFHRNQTGIKHWQMSAQDGRFYWGASSGFDRLEGFVEVHIDILITT